MKISFFMGRSLVFSLVLFFIYTPSFALKTTIANDSITVKKLLDSAYVLESSDKKAALKLYQVIMSVSKKANYPIGIAKALSYSGIVYSAMGQYDNALAFDQAAAKQYKLIKNVWGEGASYNNMGIRYVYLSKYDSALICYQKAIELFTDNKMEADASPIYLDIGHIYFVLKQYGKATDFYLKGIKTAEKAKDSASIANGLINYAGVLWSLNEKKKVFPLQKRALQIGNLMKNSYIISIASSNLSDYYKDSKNYDSALVYSKNGMAHVIKHGAEYDIARVKWRTGDLYIYNKKYNEANILLNEALTISTKIKAKDVTSSIYSSLEKLYKEKGNYKEAYHYLSLSKNLNDSILGENQIKTINELEVKYQTAQKDQQLVQKQLQIAKQDLRIKQKTRILLITISSIVLLLIIASFVFVNYRNKMKLQNQHLILLEKEKEISNLEATIKGEEKERSRIAKNLHDGVGGLLSAAKMHFSIFKTEDRLLTQPEFFKALDLLDDSATEIRKIAHNLMPELLINHGLIDALSHFIKRINTSQLKIDLISIGELPKCNENLELTVYRIIQELINNIIKHAEATEVLVQLSYQDDLLAITVEDNGKGFDPATVGSNGAGLSNMENRVKTFGGTFELNSSKGNGTTVFIEFELTTELKYV